jgi:sulfite exporter TauE/SafE
MSISLTLALTVGLVSALHCMSMCGGIMGALTMSLPQSIRRSWTQLSLFALSYNLGRIASYALAGAVMAGVGDRLFALLPGDSGHAALRILAAVIMLGIGFYLAGWFPDFARVERLGMPVWRRLEPYGRRLLPVRTPAQAFGFGVVWGWLPCGLVYSMLLTASTQGSAGNGALFMAAFGLGTLPAVAAAALLTGRVAHLRAQRPLRLIGGLVIIGLALATLLFPGAGAPESVEALHAH